MQTVNLLETEEEMGSMAFPGSCPAVTLAKISQPLCLPRPVFSSRRLRSKPNFAAYASVSAATPVPTTRPVDDLVQDILSKVDQTDRGVLLARDEHEKVDKLAKELQTFCVDEPVRCPLIFGEWDVQYCSNPTSPGGGYRSAFGRLFFKTKEMIQVVEAPDVVRNMVSFTLLGLVDGEVSLNGKLTALDEKWIQVVFEPPELKVGGLEFKYGGQSEVKLQITYVNEKIRLGKGSRGSLFVFQRRKPNM